MEKQPSHLFPQAFFAADFGQRGLKELAGSLLGLIHEESQLRHQESKNHREMVFAMYEIVLELMPLVFEGVEGFVLNLPTCPSCSHEGINIAAHDGEIRNPGEILFSFIADFPILEEIDQQVGVRSIGGLERNSRKVRSGKYTEVKIGASGNASDM